MRPLLVAAVAASVLAGCSRERRQPVEPDFGLANLQWADVGLACAASSPAVPLPQALRDSLTAPSHAHLDVVWADLARAVPGGWGGLFRLDGAPLMYLVDTTALADAILALDSASFAVPAGTAAVKGRWDFAQMHDWNRYLQPRVLAGTNITMVDVQEARNRIEYYVRDEASRPLLEARLRQLGVPACLVAIGIAAPISFAGE